MGWSKDWIVKIETTKNNDRGGNDLELFPLQLANCNRLEENDTVYIFDEVGSGKTISSGLMALHYLYNNPGKSVLVITVNALVDSKNGGDGPFRRKLRNLPFDALGIDMDRQVKIVNNHCSRIEKQAREWGLIIIDEAHKFLKKNAEKQKKMQDELRDLCAEKVVFLTATPIVYSAADLYTYADIARSILNRLNPDDGWIKSLNIDCGSETTKEDLICGQFNPKSPVTRYFKDTIQALRDDGTLDLAPQRMLADVWEYESCYFDYAGNQARKRQALLENIRNVLKEKTGERHRFVVFTRFVEKEAKALRDFLSEELTTAVVTGENSAELENYSSPDSAQLPTVLILTYQLAEQGVDLPGYNHVVNYHISGNPSSLEQRYGRVDRLNSKAKKISIHFLVAKGAVADSDSFNFGDAVYQFIWEYLPRLPAKNVILTKEVLTAFRERAESFELYAKRIRCAALNDENLRRIIKIEASNAWEKSNQELRKPGEKEDLFQSLREFVDGFRARDEEEKKDRSSQKIQVPQRADSAGISKLRKDIETVLTDSGGKWMSKSIREQLDDVITNLLNRAENDIGNKIFYMTRQPGKDEARGEALRKYLDRADAVEDCAEQIKGSEAYQEYYDDTIAPLRKFAEYSGRLNGAYQERFDKGKLADIFDGETGRWNREKAKDICQELVPEQSSPDKGIDSTSDTLYECLCNAYQQLSLFWPYFLEQLKRGKRPNTDGKIAPEILFYHCRDQLNEFYEQRLEDGRFEDVFYCGQVNNKLENAQEVIEMQWPSLHNAWRWASFLSEAVGSSYEDLEFFRPCRDAWNIIEKDEGKYVSPAGRFLLSTCWNGLEQAYEQRFQDNRLEDIFCAGGDWNEKRAKDICREVLERTQISFLEDDLDFACSELYGGLCAAYKKLPFFKMCGRFGKCLEQQAFSKDNTSDHSRRIKRSFNQPPYQQALERLVPQLPQLWRELKDFGVPDDTFVQYLEECIKRGNGEIFYVNHKDGCRKASQWLRLVYQLTYDSDVESWGGSPIKLFWGFEHTEGGQPRDNPNYRLDNQEYPVEETDWWTLGILKDGQEKC